MVADAAVVGDGLDEATHFGPLQNRVHYEVLQKYLEIAGRDGQIIAGGEVLDRPGSFNRPTVVRDMEDTSPLV